MKKSLLILLILFLLSGCTILRIDSYDYEKIIDKVLSLNIKNYNIVGKGYKYYAPYGIVRTNSSDYNDTLESKNNTYYLYVDVVSYYYKSEILYPDNKDSYFYKKLNYDDKKGYVNIIKKDDKLYVQIFYNYAKIETYIEESELKNAATDISYILSSIKFNDSLLKKMYESGNLESKEEVYKLFDNKEKKGNFIEYIKEFDKYDEDDIKEEEIKQEEKKESTTTSENKSDAQVDE